MSYDVIIKRGDTRNCIKAVLKDTSGSPVDLTDCRVNFHMARIGRQPNVSRATHIENAAVGEVWVVWAPGETDISGIYRAEFEVIYKDGRHETFPNNGYVSIQILNDLRQ